MTQESLKKIKASLWEAFVWWIIPMVFLDDGTPIGSVMVVTYLIILFMGMFLAPRYCEMYKYEKMFEKMSTKDLEEYINKNLKTI